MAAIQHPTFHDIRQDVPDDVIDQWLAAGWVVAAEEAPDSSMVSTGDVVQQNSTDSSTSETPDTTE